MPALVLKKSPPLLAIFALAAAAHAAPASRSIFQEPMVDVARACPGVVIDLRYAGSRNVTGRPIYPQGARALLRGSVAERLSRAQHFLKAQGFGLKVWDAYRPAWAQRQLWNAVRDPEYVVEPSGIGSLHGWGAAVDVTLVDARGREVRMPTDFDAFSDAAHSNYRGDDPEIVSNLATLKRAMATAGFNHIHDEWWHYSAGNAPGCGPIEVALVAPSSAHKEVAKARTDRAVKAAQANAIAALKKGKPRAARVLFAKHASEPS